MVPCLLLPCCMQFLNTFSPDDAQWSSVCSCSLTTILPAATNQQEFEVLVGHGSRSHTLVIHNLEASESRKEVPCRASEGELQSEAIPDTRTCEVHWYLQDIHGWICALLLQNLTMSSLCLSNEFSCSCMTNRPVACSH
jgi:hypothetical protein